MKILIVNDDGYSSEGIVKLAAALNAEHDVTVIAPVRCMSGMAHAMTFGKPIHLKEIAGKYPYKCFSLTGTPADCVKLGVELMSNDPPQMVISGINTEPNIGTTVVYSGTAGAAMEANLLGIKYAFAVSGNPDSHADFDYIVRYFIEHFDYYMHLASKDYALNININNERIGNSEHKITTIGNRLFSDIYLVGTPDEKGVPYTLVGNPIHIANADDCDVIWYGKGYATVTPLTCNHTLHTAMTKLKAKAKRYL